MKAYLALANGMIFEGEHFGYEKSVYGELVFTTNMTGYLETLTDKSYYGQIVIQTFPLIGNYGYIESDLESKNIHLFGYIVREFCEEPSNFRSQSPIEEFLIKNKIPGIAGLDTRQITKIIRKTGCINAYITTDKDSIDFDKIKAFEIGECVSKVSVDEPVMHSVENPIAKVALMDYGYKENILRELNKRDCEVVVYPYDTKIEQIKKDKCNGIMLSNGPGDPAINTEVIENIKDMAKSDIPIFGICLGHQLMALASGFDTMKLKFGHRGANQPVVEKNTGLVCITSQNHGYAVDNRTVDESKAEVWFTNLNDGSSEGIIYKDKDIMTTQFHPEACSGPLDMNYLFNKFLGQMVG